jgi:hypothetical protein
MLLDGVPPILVIQPCRPPEKAAPQGRLPDWTPDILQKFQGWQ